MGSVASRPAATPNAPSVLAGSEGAPWPRRPPSRLEPVERSLTSCHGLIGQSTVMQALFVSVERFAPHARATLITGETGTGKAALARALHQIGPRRDGAFVSIHCASPVGSALDHSHGRPLTAFWASLAGHDAVESAEGPVTLFFDEVADLPMPLQSLLVHTLEAVDHGSPGSRGALDLHVIAASSRDLLAEIAAGRFRSDLYYRLGVFELHVPPLRERLDDLPDLASAFLAQISLRFGRSTPVLTGSAKRVLQALPWPGNLRELRNVLERASLLGEGGLVGDAAIRAAFATANQVPSAKSASGPTEASARLDDAQRSHVRAVLESTHGNKSLAAARLGISRRALYRLLDKLAA